MLTNKSDAVWIETPDSDLKVVNSARVSFSKIHHEFDSKADTGLIRYLATHDHWTPFAHCRNTMAFYMPKSMVAEFIISMGQEINSATIYKMVDLKGILVIRTSLYGFASMANKIVSAGLIDFYPMYFQILDVLKSQYPVSTQYLIKDDLDHDEYRADYEVPPVHEYVECLDPYFTDVTLKINTPIFVARQDFKHMVGRVFNEVSRRYVDDEPNVYFPDVWRGRAENKKQGSLSTACEFFDEDGINSLRNSVQDTVNVYNELITLKIAPEQARMILPQSMMTEYYVTAHIPAWNRFLNQREDDHAQEEIRDLAVAVKRELSKALLNKTFND